MSQTWPAGIIRKTPITPEGPTNIGAASGVWTLEEAAYWTKKGQWPTAGVVRGIFAGGGVPTTNAIEYITINTTGNAADFGDMPRADGFGAGCSSYVRGVFGGGGGATAQNYIDYITMNTLGNAADFGDLTVVRRFLAAYSSETRGVFSGGQDNVGNSNVIDYVTIASVGNATDFGDLTIARYGVAGCSSTTRGLTGGGVTAGTTFSNRIDYTTIASTGNATNFGNLSVTRGDISACSSSTRGVFAGGYTYNGATVTGYNTIDYVTIASAGNATDFGDLTIARYRSAGTSSPLRGVFGGGTDAYENLYNVIDYITIASTGNATDFGDLTVASIGWRAGVAACSSGHGGLG